jgi:MerR family redox-sensitive transcriptional activator SoxR
LGLSACALQLNPLLASVACFSLSRPKVVLASRCCSYGQQRRHCSACHPPLLLAFSHEILQFGFATSQLQMLKVEVNFKSRQIATLSPREALVKIGELADRTGMNASAIRYYEKLGLLAPPLRSGGQRRYSDEALHRVLLIRFAGEMGFSLNEIKLFLSGLQDGVPVGPRWKKLAQRKFVEVDESIKSSRRLKSLLQHLLHCRCTSLKLCVQRLSLNPDLRLSGRAPS